MRQAGPGCPPKLHPRTGTPQVAQQFAFLERNASKVGGAEAASETQEFTHSLSLVAEGQALPLTSRVWSGPCPHTYQIAALPMSRGNSNWDQRTLPTRPLVAPVGTCGLSINCSVEAAGFQSQTSATDWLRPSQPTRTPSVRGIQVQDTAFQPAFKSKVCFSHSQTPEARNAPSNARTTRQPDQSKNRFIASWGQGFGRNTKWARVESLERAEACPAVRPP